MIPKYAFSVVIDYKLGHDNQIKRHVAAFETLATAMSCYEQHKSKPNTRRVQVICIMEDWAKSEGGLK